MQALIKSIILLSKESNLYLETEFVPNLIINTEGTTVSFEVQVPKSIPFISVNFDVVISKLILLDFDREFNIVREEIKIPELYPGDLLSLDIPFYVPDHLLRFSQN